MTAPNAVRLTGGTLLDALNSEHRLASAPEQLSRGHAMTARLSVPISPTRLAVGDDQEIPMAVRWQPTAFGVDVPFEGMFFSYVMRLAPGCADVPIARALLREDDKERIDANVDHEGIPWATTANETLRVWADSSGVWAEGTRSPLDAAAEQLFLAVAEGRMLEASIYFTMGEWEWREYTGDDEQFEGTEELYITKMEQIFDVTFTSRGRSVNTDYQITPLNQTAPDASDASDASDAPLGRHRIGPPPPPQ